MNDAEFKEYIKQGEQRIRECFRLPALLCGEIQDYNRASSESAKLVAEEEIFMPERATVDEVFNFTLLDSMKIKYFRLYTRGPKLMDASNQVDAISKITRAGGLSVNDATRIANRVLDLDRPLYDGEWAKIPFMLLLELIKKEQVGQIDDVGLGVNKSELESAKDTIQTMKESGEFDAVMNSLEEVQDQLDSLFNLVAKTD
jgi:capsid portal protein